MAQQTGDLKRLEVYSFVRKFLPGVYEILNSDQEKLRSFALPAVYLLTKDRYNLSRIGDGLLQIPALQKPDFSYNP